jgi:hypothetical protein
MNHEIAAHTDEFDVVLDLASSTIADGDTVCAMRLARGILALEAYANVRLAKLEKVAEAARSLKTTSFMRLEQGGRFLVDEHDWYRFCEALKELDEGAG